MAQILSIQSAVVFGRVGHGASAFPLERLGHDVWRVPTVLLTNHTGYPEFYGPPVRPDEIRQLLERMRLRFACDAILTGYLGHPTMAQLVAEQVGALKGDDPTRTYLCDPVLGDTDKGFYVPEDLVETYRRQLLPNAAMATPNVFELGALTGTTPGTLAEIVAAARDLMAFELQTVVVTSVTQGLAPDEIGLLAVTPHAADLVVTPRLPMEAKGAGDLVAALLLAFWLEGRSAAEAAMRAASIAHAIIAETHRRGLQELALIQGQDAIVAPPTLFTPRRVDD
ncbi:MAG: pyridoxal kinase [Pseudomonadota bacterium]